MMASKKLITLKDDPTEFKPIDELKINGFWDPSITDLYLRNMNREITNLMTDQTYTLDNYNTGGIDYISGTNHLFTSEVPNPYFTNLSNADVDGGNCLQIKSTGKGHKSVWFGKPFIMDYLSTNEEYRWIKPTGLTFKIKIHKSELPDANFKIQNLRFIYKKRYETKFYSACMVEDGTVCNTNPMTLVSENQHVYYVEQECVNKLRSGEYYCLGLYLEYATDVESAIDIYNFRPLMTDYNLKTQNSVFILPPPMTLDERQSLRSSPIL